MSEKQLIFITFGNHVIPLHNIAYFEICPNQNQNKYVIICHMINQKKILHGEFPSKLVAHLYLNSVYYAPLSRSPSFISVGHDYVIRADFIMSFTANRNHEANDFVITVNLCDNKCLSWGKFSSKNEALTHINKNILHL